MEKIIMHCPCCGQPFVFPHDGGVAAVPIVSNEDEQTIASRFGIELGALKGGEKIGD